MSGMLSLLLLQIDQQERSPTRIKRQWDSHLELHSKKLLFIRKARNEHGAGVGDEHFFFQLDTFAATSFANIAFDADHHSGNQGSFPAIDLKIHGVSDEWSLSVHADSMHDRCVALL